MPFDITSIGSIVTAIGALGTSSFGLVDATKVFGGGVSLCGLADIEKALLPLFGGGAANRTDTSTPLAYGSIFENLKANWINGVALEEQKANAKILVKLSLNANTAVMLAKVTGVSPDVLTELAVALNLGAVLTKEETDVLNKFETALNLILDRAFQRADQRYRNSAKFLSGVFAVVLSVIGGAIFSSGSLDLGPLQGAGVDYFNSGNFWLAVVAGLLATPLAPIVKDITSALQAGSAVAQKIAAK
jgi:hypothetical protein